MAKHIIPTLGDVVAAYPEIAAVERLRNERPSKRTVVNVIMGVKRVAALLERMESGVCGADKMKDAAPRKLQGRLWMGRPISDLNSRRLDRTLAMAKKIGMKPLTVYSYLSSLKGLTAKWCLPYYQERGWKVRSVELPPCRRRAPRYVRPEREILLKVKDWYEGLWLHEDKRYWLAATMMLEFAMRNGDVGRLRWSDFRSKNSADGRNETLLCYTPHKTELSSGRIVAWPVHPDLLDRLENIRESSGLREGTHFQGLVVPAAQQVFARLNADLRSRHFFRGGKAAYELRKICIDHIYQKFGAEMASSISGDDIRTVTRYYADPSAVNAGCVRVVDLL